MEFVLHIPVALQQLQKVDTKATNNSDRQRVHVGTTYFPEGTTANEVCVYIAEKVGQRIKKSSGIWLLQMKPSDCTDGEKANLDDGAYVTIKDSKHTLSDDNQYYALYYTGPDIFLIQP